MKESFYFSHDYNAQNDSKVEDMRFIMGWEGYGIYWALVERLAQESSHRLPTNYKRIAFAMQSEEERIRMVVEDFGLFEVKGGFFISNRLMSHFAEREEKKRKAQESALKRWQPEAKKDANASETQSEIDAIKERKGKEIKKKEIQKHVFISEYSENFQKKYEEWIEYRKQSKKKLTQITIDRQLAKCREWGESNAIKSIETSIERQWAGLFPYEDEQKKQQKHNGIDYEAEKKKTLEREKAANEAKRKEKEESDRKKREDDKILRWLDSLPESRKEQIEKEISENHMVTRLRMPPEDAPESEKESQRNIINSAKKMVRITLARKYYFQDNQ